MFAKIFFSLLLAAGPASAQCLSLDKPVTLSGYAVETTLPGPPSFEDVGSGDKRLRVTFLYSPSGYCVDGITDHVRLIQTTCEGGKPGKLYDIPGKLYKSHTGYHWSPVVLECK